MGKLAIQFVRGASAFLTGRLSIGLFIKNNDVVLIDSGIDKQTAKQVDDALHVMQLTPRAIINTHSHADHCGGNAYFQKKYKLDIFATQWEKAFIERV